MNIIRKLVHLLFPGALKTKDAGPPASKQEDRPAAPTSQQPGQPPRAANDGPPGSRVRWHH